MTPGTLLGWSVWISLGLLSAGLVLSAWRALAGPQVEDRVVALDTAAVILMGLLVVASIQLREISYLDYALVLAMLSFVTTIAFARYVERGVLIEPDARDSD